MLLRFLNCVKRKEEEPKLARKRGGDISSSTIHLEARHLLPSCVKHSTERLCGPAIPSSCGLLVPPGNGHLDKFSPPLLKEEKSLSLTD
jgi:hypothetical protein